MPFSIALFPYFASRATFVTAVNIEVRFTRPSAEVIHGHKVQKLKNAMWLEDCLAIAGLGCCRCVCVSLKSSQI